MHQSVATIDSPEFLNLQPLDINPLMSKCEIKVLYVGANRNRTFISKEVAAEIGKTLRGAPIVGYYKQKKEDFADHGEKMIIDDEGIHFECQTIPYGFVAPDSEVWFQDFEDSDDMGNVVTHTYLMTTGYLWTSQFPESSLPVEEGRPQSMEFFEASVDGRWEYNYDKEMDYFIINDAIIQKLCILGDDVEPCFQGASVTAPNVSKKFTLDNNFKNTLYSMIQDLKKVLNGGEKQMEKVLEPTTEFTATEEKTETAGMTSEVEGDSNEATFDYTKKDEDTEEKKDTSSDETSKDDDAAAKEEDSKENKEKAQKNFTIEDVNKLQTEYNNLEIAFNNLKYQCETLQNQLQELTKFKTEIDNQKKDALISEFYMLTDADKADVLQNKEKYTYDEIKAKLSVICFDKKINFTVDEKETATENIVTYTLEETTDNLPEWVKAVKEQEKLGY